MSLESSVVGALRLPLAPRRISGMGGRWEVGGRLWYESRDAPDRPPAADRGRPLRDDLWHRDPAGRFRGVPAGPRRGLRVEPRRHLDGALDQSRARRAGRIRRGRSLGSLRAPRPARATVALAGTGFALVSTVDALWQLYLFVGVLSGLGMSSFYLLSATTVTHWFDERRGLALALVLVGFNLGYIGG